MHTSVQALQRKSGGESGYCNTSTFPVVWTTTFISRDVHHRMLYQSGSVAVSAASECIRVFRIKVYVKHVSGSAVVVHKQGTITAAIPPS